MRLILFSILLFAATTAGAAEPADGSIEVPGGKLWYEARGEGTAMVFLHDGLVSSAGWEASFDSLSRDFRVVRYDRRGFGRSEPAKGVYSDVEDLHALFETLKLGHAVLVGCSNGSRLAVDYALAHPDQVEALVLVGPVVSGLPYSEHFQRRGLFNYRPMFQEKNREKLIEAWVQDPYLTDARDAEARKRLRDLLTKSPGPLTAPGPESRAPEHPAVGRLGEIHVPTLIVAGASDIPDVHAHAGALEAGIHGARRIVVPEAGHLVQLEKPTVLDYEIRAFLRPAALARQILTMTSNTIHLDEHRKLFAYDTAAPLDIQEAGTERRGDVRIVVESRVFPWPPCRFFSWRCEAGREQSRIELEGGGIRDCF